MISMFRSTALAAALAVASFGASAGSVVFNFDSLGQDAFNAMAPVAVTGEKQGLIFSNAFAYDSRMLGAGDLTVPNGTTGAFMMNDDRVPTIVNGKEVFSGISITRGSGMVSRGEYFNLIDMSVFDSGRDLVYSLFSGNTARGDYPPSTSNIGNVWNRRNSSWADTFQVDRIEITAGDSAYFGLRSLTIGLTAGSGGGNVPEPGSYALVGLALLAAGAASRRRT